MGLQRHEVKDSGDISFPLPSSGSVGNVGSVTKNFLSESPLSQRVQDALGEAIEQGWQDPRKLSQHSGRARILHNSAIELFASQLKVQPPEVEVLGEPALAPFYALGGLLRPEDTLLHCAVDRKEIFAIARNHGKVHELSVNPKGRIVPESLPEHSNTVFLLQGGNGETGVLQDVEGLVSKLPLARIACDFFTSGPRLALPSRWETAIFDAKSWQGPQGISLLLIREGAAWRNPLPHLNSVRTPQSASLPLLIASAVALEEWARIEMDEGLRIRNLTQLLRDKIHSSIEDCDIAGDLDDSLPHITSLSFLYVQGEELLRKLEYAGFSVDSGSACTADDLQPSHVLAAMGLLTHGNIRITLHHGAKEEEVLAVVAAIQDAVQELRSS